MAKNAFKPDSDSSTPTDYTPRLNPWQTLSIYRARPLDEADLAAKVRNLRNFPLGVDGDVRVSLGGVQEKLVLTRTKDGWGLPVEGSASTHILKPERPDMAGHVVSEAFCLRVAAALGLSAAKVALTTIAGRRVIVVERFDRRVHDDGEITRVHQENGCQALGIRVSSVPLKYEESGGPSLRHLAGVLTRWGSPTDLEMLLAQTLLNVLVGNADGHGMNTSFILPGDGKVRLSPVYDVFSSLMYDVSSTLGMFINDVRDIRSVTRQDLVAEGIRWGIPRPTAQSLVETLLAGAPGAVEAAANQTPEASDEMIDFLTERVSLFA